MRKITKNLFVLLLAILMCATSAVPAFAADICPGSANTHTVSNCTYKEIGAKAATCYEAGYVTYSCNTCAAEFIVSTPKLDSHNYTETTISASCTTAGITTKYCSTCGDRSIETVEALGHEWVYTWDAADKTADACVKGSKYISRTCSRCFVIDNIPGTVSGHEWAFTEVKLEPTCMTEGLAVYTCARCNKTSEAKIAKLGTHADCTKIGVVKPATCTENGVSAYFCKTCDKTFEAADPTAPKGHGTLGWVIPEATSQSCTTDLILATDKICKACGTLCKITGVAYTEDELKIRAAKHTWESTIIQVASCTATGTVRKACTSCGAVEFESIEALGHLVRNIPGTPATCKSIGYTDSSVCDRCGITIKAKEAIPMLAHSYKEISRAWENVYVTEATDKVVCGEKLVITSECTLCKDIIKDYITYVDHEYTKVNVVAPTCSTKGYSEYVCKFCGKKDITQKEFDETAINPDNHILPKVGEGLAIGSGANCFEAGREIAECKHCDYSTVRDVPARGHDFTEVDNTYYADPSIKYGNTVSRVANTGTCLVKSEYLIKCNNCDEVKHVVIEDGTGLGHTKNLTVGYTTPLAPTCIHEGTSEGWTCANDDWCTYSVAAKTIPAIHADFENGLIHVEKVDATCFAGGNIEYYVCPLGDKCAAYNKEDKVPYICTKYGAITKDDITIKKLKHSVVNTYFNEAGIALYSVASCTTYGYNTTICEHCDEHIVVTNFVPMLKHDFSGKSHNIDSCESGAWTINTCKTCGKTDAVQTRPAGHIVVIGNESNKLTSSCGDINESRVCTACGEVVVKDDHTFDTPTLLDNNLKYICTACGTTKFVEHNEHTWVEDKCICGEVKPEETLPPETEAPIETEAPEVTEIPETEPPVDTEPEETTPPDSEPTVDLGFEMNSTYWAIIILIVAVIVTIAFIFFVSRKRKN